MVDINKTTFNTDKLLHEIESVTRTGLAQIMEDFIQRYKLYEETHNCIMNLPSVRYELLKANNIQSTSHNDTQTDSTSELTHIATIKALLDEVDKLKKEIALLQKQQEVHDLTNDMDLTITIKEEKENIQLNMEEASDDGLEEELKEEKKAILRDHQI